MAEAHPVGFQWVMEAKARGAKVIHVDPRFTRTSALADLHVTLRAGTDIAPLGALINYVLSNEKDFREYVVAYTNASTIISEDFVDSEEVDGLFSGFNEESRHYDSSSWQYEGPQEAAAAGQRDQPDGTADGGGDGSASPAPEDGMTLTGMSYDNTVGLGASTWRHVAFIEQNGAARSQAAATTPDATTATSDARATTGVPVTLGMPGVAPSGTGVMGEVPSFCWLMESDVCSTAPTRRGWTCAPPAR